MAEAKASRKEAARGAEPTQLEDGDEPDIIEKDDAHYAAIRYQLYQFCDGLAMPALVPAGTRQLKPALARVTAPTEADIFSSQ